MAVYSLIVLMCRQESTHSLSGCRVQFSVVVGRPVLCILCNTWCVLLCEWSEAWRGGQCSTHAAVGSTTLDQWHSSAGRHHSSLVAGTTRRRVTLLPVQQPRRVTVSTNRQQLTAASVSLASEHDRRLWRSESTRHLPLTLTPLLRCYL